MEKKFEHGLLSSYSYTYADSNDNQKACVHYWWVYGTYNLYTGEIIDIEIVDLGCLTCAPNSLCAELTSLGGAGGVSVPIERTTSHTVALFGDHIPAGYNDWEAYCNYSVTGMFNATNPATSTFESCTLNGGITIIPQNGALVWLPNGFYYFEITSYNHTENVSTHDATCTMSCICNFINQPAPDNTKVYVGYHHFTSEDI